MNDLISVIVPVYNCEKYLDRCIESLINQTYKNIEIILINDGSKDNSLEICNKWQKNDNRIIVINKENGGVSSARNKGLEIAKGKYISFIDSDDYLDINCYNTLLENNGNYDVIVFNYYYDFINYKKVGITNFGNGKFEYELFRKNSIQGYACNKLYKSEIINKIRFDEKIKICEDLLFNINICIQNNGIRYRYFDTPFYYYYQNEESACNTKFMLDITKFIAYSKIIDNLESYNENLSKTRKIEFIIDFNDFRMLSNYKNDNQYNMNDLVKKYKKDLRRISIKDRLKIFMSCHMNKIYYNLRLSKNKH